MKLALEYVDTIFSDGRHNAFTSICRWRDKYYVAFRSSSTHASPGDKGWKGSGLRGGHVKLLESADLKNWKALTIIDTERDDRDPKLLATEERLLAYATSIGEDGNQQAFVSWTEDGVHWRPPREVYERDYGFWQPKEHEGMYYVAADIDDSPSDTATADRGRVELLRSSDGIHWQAASTITEGNCCTETELVFLQDGRVLAIVRQNLLAFARPPYVAWEDHKLDLRLGMPGPTAVQVGHDVLIVCRALCEEGKGLTDSLPDCVPAIYVLNLRSMRLTRRMDLPTRWAGDVSYAGILLQGENRMLISYYDGGKYQVGVPKRSDIRLAAVRIQSSAQSGK